MLVKLNENIGFNANSVVLYHNGKLFLSDVPVPLDFSNDPLRGVLEFVLFTVLPSFDASSAYNDHIAGRGPGAGQTIDVQSEVVQNAPQGSAPTAELIDLSKDPLLLIQEIQEKVRKHAGRELSPEEIESILAQIQAAQGITAQTQPATPKPKVIEMKPRNLN